MNRIKWVLPIARGATGSANDRAIPSGWRPVYGILFILFILSSRDPRFHPLSRIRRILSYARRREGRGMSAVGRAGEGRSAQSSTERETGRLAWGSVNRRFA